MRNTHQVFNVQINNESAQTTRGIIRVRKVYTNSPSTDGPSKIQTPHVPTTLSISCMQASIPHSKQTVDSPQSSPIPITSLVCMITCAAALANERKRGWKAAVNQLIRSSSAANTYRSRIIWARACKNQCSVTVSTMRYPRERVFSSQYNHSCAARLLHGRCTLGRVRALFRAVMCRWIIWSKLNLHLKQGLP